MHNNHSNFDYSSINKAMALFISLFICSILSTGRAQNLEIKVIDKSTNSVPFSSVYLRNLSNYSVSLLGAFTQDLAIDPAAKYEVICAGYARIVITGEDILARKTLFIQPLEYTFGAVEVEKLSKKLLMTIWEKTLNNCRKTQHRRNPTTYVHFLSSEQDNQVREVLLCYGLVSNDKNKPRLNITGGDFRIQRNNPFFNFHTSFWVLENSTFQNRLLFNNLPSQVPSSALDSYKIYSNSNLTDSLVLLEFTRSDGNLHEKILINKNTRHPKTSTVIIKNDWSFKFLSGESLRIDSAHIRVDFFPHSFIPEQIHYHIRFADKTPIDVQGFFMASDPPKFNQINTKIGAYQPRHMYEQIIMKRQNLISDKVIDPKFLDSLFLPGANNESLLLTQLSSNRTLTYSKYDELLEQFPVLNSSHSNIYKNNQRVSHQNTVDFTWFLRVTEDRELIFFPSFFGESYLVTNNEYWWHRLLAIYCVEYIEYQRQKTYETALNYSNWEEQLDYIKKRKATIDLEMKQLLAFPLRYSPDYAIQYVYKSAKKLNKDFMPIFFNTAFMNSIDMPFESLPSLKLLWSDKQLINSEKQDLTRYYIELHEKAIKQHKRGEIILYPLQLVSLHEDMVWVVSLVEEKTKLCYLILELEAIMQIPSSNTCDKRQ